MPASPSRRPAVRAAAALAATASVLAAGCGDDEADGAGSTRAASTTPAARFVLEAAPGAQPAVVRRAASVLRLRALRLGHRGASTAVAGRRIAVRVPGASPTDRSLRAALTQRGRLELYDWEPNVAGPQGTPRPTDPQVTGGPNAGTTSVCHSRKAAQRTARRVAGRATLVRAEVPDGRPPADCFYVLAGAPALTGADITHPEQAFDQQTQQPIVTFEFTRDGRARFHALTRAVARRGADRRRAAPGADPALALQHFTIAVDGALRSTPYVDDRQNPDGVDGTTGAQIAGGFTVALARALAVQLASGELPATLRLVSAT